MVASMEVKAPRLLPCPFCRGQDLEPTSDEFGDIMVYCRSCSASGPRQRDDGIHAWQLVALLWNQRPVSPR